MDAAEKKLMREIGARVRRQRRAAEMTMGEAGDIIGQSADAFSKAERGERRFTIADVVKLSERLGCAVEFLIHGRSR